MVVAYNRRYYEANREKVIAQSRAWNQAHPERVQENRRRHQDAHPFRRRHGMSAAEWARMFATQQGACYLCGDPLPSDRKNVNIDHDHRCCPRTESCQRCRRGLACSACNLLIGLALDDPERLRRIADNLEMALADVTRRLASKPVQGELMEIR